MKKQAIPITLTVLLLKISSIVAQIATSVSANDFQLILGKWNGTLTYLDYSSNKPYTMPANGDIRQLGKSRTFVFSNSYPDEPKANSFDTMTISKDGKMLNTEAVKFRRKVKNGITEVVTELQSIDGNGNKPAIIRHTHLISKDRYNIIKEVQFTGHNEWIKRNEYSYMRK